MTEKSASQRLLQDHIVKERAGDSDIYVAKNIHGQDIEVVQMPLLQLRAVGELLNQFEAGTLQGMYQRAEESAVRWASALQRQAAGLNRLLAQIETKDEEIRKITADRDAAAEMLRLAHELQERQRKEVVAIGDECETLKLEMREKQTLIAKLGIAVGKTAADLVTENERLAAELADSKLGEENLQRELADLKAGRAAD